MTLRRITSGLVAAAALALAGATAQAQETTITVAEADTITGENLVELVAFERAAERGVTVETISLKSDDVVFQAVLNGQADIGIGAAYQAIQTLEAPIRHFYQLRRLAYFPVVDSTKYDNWADLDGEVMAVHSRGSGTEAMARYMEKVHGISYSQLSYVPGSEVRAVAMRRGTMSASFLDLTNSRLLTEEEPDRFKILATGDETASDSILYGRNDFLDENTEAVQIVLEELLVSAREIMEDPSRAAELREEMGLLPDLPEEMVEEITPYFQVAKQAGLFPTNGGGEQAARADISFFTDSGTLEGSPDTIDVENFWRFDILEAAREAVAE
ncbi:MAG: ABC transporter substrate-binding protein [Azospirillaceae bacterium]